MTEITKAYQVAPAGGGEVPITLTSGIRQDEAVLPVAHALEWNSRKSQTGITAPTGTWYAENTALLRIAPVLLR